MEPRAKVPALVLGSDRERWAPHDKSRMVSPAWRGVQSAVSAAAQSAAPPSQAMMRSSTLGIMQDPRTVPGARIVRSPGATSPPGPKSPEMPLSPSFGAPSRMSAAADEQSVSIALRRAQRRIQLQQSTHGVHRVGIPLYGARRVLPLAPRRGIERVDGALYDEDGPFREGAVSDNLSVRLFYAPATGLSYLITTPDNRVSSAAKRRRWAMDQHGAFYAAMEIKSITDKLRLVHESEPYPPYAHAIAGDLAQHFIGDVLDELQKAETLAPSDTPPHVLETEDGRLVRLEEDFPEEVFFLIAGCSDEELVSVIYYVFAETIEELWRIHSHGWMHGDIKLENLMIRSNGRIVLIDFENAAPFRGSHTHDGHIQLLSFDWTPPELEHSHLGRRMGPTGDLWALGCNLVRAFALRDGVEDGIVRHMLLEDGLHEFFQFRTSLRSASAAYGIDLHHVHTSTCMSARLLRRFARDAPRLCQYIIAHALAPSPSERDEAAGVALARALYADPANAALWDTVRGAIESSIEHSGSTWVRPKLDDARAILELD